MRLRYLPIAAILGLTFTAGAQAAVTEWEGSGGGGLIPWAMLHPTGPLVSYTNVKTADYTVQTLALGGTLMDRLEVSLAQTIVNAIPVGAALGLDSRVSMNTLGLKLKLIDMGKDNAVPQVAIGLQNKHTSGSIIDALRAGNAISSTSGTDWYVAATKVIDIGGKNVLLNGTLRATKADQMGLLGFGGGAAGNNSYHYKPEVAAGVFVADNVVVGAEYRTRPNNVTALGFDESATYDIFMAYFINKNMALTVAYANFGQIGPSAAALGNPAYSNRQDGLYLQLQANF